MRRRSASSASSSPSCRCLRADPAWAADKTVRVLYIDDGSRIRAPSSCARPHAARVMAVTYAKAGMRGSRQWRGPLSTSSPSDHFMPGKGKGLESCFQEIRANPAPAPLIYVTGADEGRIARGARLKNGAADLHRQGSGRGLLRTARRLDPSGPESRNRVRRAKGRRKGSAARDSTRAEMLPARGQITGLAIRYQPGGFPSSPCKKGSVARRSRPRCARRDANPHRPRLAGPPGGSTRRGDVRPFEARRLSHLA